MDKQRKYGKNDTTGLETMKEKNGSWNAQITLHIYINRRGTDLHHTRFIVVNI